MKFHRPMRRVSMLGLVATALSIYQAPQAIAQTFPSRPVKLVVTYPPGGSSDLMARVMARKMQEAWGQAVVVENKSGAAGSVGMEYAKISAKALEPTRTQTAINTLVHGKMVSPTAWVP